MDFSWSEDQRAILELAGRILEDGTPRERLRELERGEGPRFDPDLWSRLAIAGLLGVAVPEAHGGAGLGFLEVAGIVEQLGRTAAPVPYLETVVLGALPIAEFGSAAQQGEWLPRVARGEAIFTAALGEPAADGAPPVVASARADGWRLSGSRLCVPAAQLAQRILVPAQLGAGDVAIFLLDPKSEGVEVVPLDTTSGRPEAHLELREAVVGPGDLLGDSPRGEAVVAWIALRHAAALSALAVGVCDEALRRTAEYAVTRKQFDQPIGLFQAVGHRAADAYVDTEGVRLTSLQAAWRIAAGLPAAREVAVAAHWACEAGQRVVHAAQHLHGGIGVDRDYPLHRGFLLAKHLELALGGATRQLLRLGDLLAEGEA